MRIKDKIQADLKDAMKANDEIKRDALRSLSSMIKNTEIKEGRQEKGIGDKEVMKIIGSAVKQRKDSMEQYGKGGRADLAGREERELEILSVYLPRQLATEEIKEIVEKAVKQTGAQSKSDMGKVMGVAMKQISGRADGNLVKKIVEEILA